MAISDNEQRGPERPRTHRLDDLKPGVPNTSDEAGDASIQNADNPMVVREEVKNTSDSSGLHATDEAAGEKIKEQLRKGHQLVSRMD